jgi:hypothetical protein
MHRYLDATRRVSGAPAQTKASCLQSSHAPKANDPNMPNCDKTFENEHRLARMEGCAISDM